MGRRSKLTPEQWIELERRHVVDGESINSLSEEYGINESSIRRKIKPRNAESQKPDNPLKRLAIEKAVNELQGKSIDYRIAELPYAKQQIVEGLAKKLTNISGHLGAAGEYGAMTAHRLSMLAHSEVQKVDDVSPLESVEALKGVLFMTELANKSSTIGLNLLNANAKSKETEGKREIVLVNAPEE